MINTLQTISGGRWFKSPSPFRMNLQINHPKLCVVTGPNVSGKSLLRKIVHSFYQTNEIELIHLSQSGRCRGGIEGAFIYGTEADESTGKNSVKTLLTAFKTGVARTKPFGIFFDEPEIGASEELHHCSNVISSPPSRT